MQEEIKEILDDIKDNINETPKNMYKYNKIQFNLNECKLLLDYITNLQEENEYFNHCDEEKRKTITNLEYKIERLEEDNKQLQEENERLKIEYRRLADEDAWEIAEYKSRNEKAIEYIELGLANEEEAEELLNILKGDNK